MHLTLHTEDAAPDGPNAPTNPNPQRSAGPQPLLVRSKQAARLCGVSLPTWHRLDAAGKVPAAVRLGGAKLYRLDELAAWARHGCPPRKEWAAIWPEVGKVAR